MSQQFVEVPSHGELSDEDSGNYEEWIPSFCARFGHEYFCEVPTEFIEDDFNLTSLSQEVPHYRKALDLILDLEAISEEEEEEDEDMVGANNGQTDELVKKKAQAVNRSIIAVSYTHLYMFRAN